MNRIDFCKFSRKSFKDFCREFLIMNWFVKSSDSIEHLELYCFWIDVIKIRKSDFPV